MNYDTHARTRNRGGGNDVLFPFRDARQSFPNLGYEPCFSLPLFRAFLSSVLLRLPPPSRIRCKEEGRKTFFAMVAVAILGLWESVRTGRGCRRRRTLSDFPHFRINLFFKVAPTATVPSFGGKGESFSNHAQKIELWSHAANLGPSRRASDLVLNLDPVARGRRRPNCGSG